jgi:uncharacterized RDD family membrane protein YckC
LSDGEDPFGRRGEEETDAFGRPVDRSGSSSGGSLWSGGGASAPAPASGGWLPPSEAAPPPSPPAFRPPTDAAPDASAWTGAPQVPSPAAPAGDSAEYMQRVGAAALDFVIRAVAIVVLLFVAAAIGGESAVEVAVFPIALLVVPFYAPILMSRWEGQTVGHRAVGTRIVTKQGAPVTGGKAVLREVVIKNVVIELLGGLFTFGIVNLLNYLWPLWDAKDEALHDKMCDTRVVKA